MHFLKLWNRETAMRKTNKTILIAMVVLVGFGMVCALAGGGKGAAKRPTPMELLDKFAETVDKAHTSFITKSKSKVFWDNNVRPT